jgi:phospholipase/carboxylesterase
MRLDLLGYAALFLAATGCAHVGIGPEEPEVPRAEAPPAVVATSPGAEGGEVGGFTYIERVTGGAKSNDTLPMIVALHGRGGTQRLFDRVFTGFAARARIIVPHGTSPEGKGFKWFEARSGGSDSDFAEGARPVAAQLAAAIAELRTTRPTLGRPVVCGFSQGASLTWALVVLHPDQVATAFTFAGRLPDGLAPAAWTSPFRPEVHAFDGTNDPGNAKTRATVEDVKRMGLQADLREYPIGHEVGDVEAHDALELMATIVSRPGGP